MPGQGRRLETVLFLDIVGSTDVAAAIGDERWREVLTRFNRVVRLALKRFDGHEEGTAGDGFFATFPAPGQAVRCAQAIGADVRELGLEVRQGVHTGETETIDRQRGGLGVVIGARVMALGGAGEVLVTSTTRELVTGSGLEFAPYAARELKGVPGTWQVFALTSVDGQPLGPPLAPEEAAERLGRVHPQPFIERHARRVALGVAVLLVIAGAGAALHAAITPPPITLMAIDPSTNRVGSILRDGVQSLHRPRAITYDGSSVWQATPAMDGGTRGQLVRRSPTTGAIEATQPLDIGAGLGFAFGYAWVAQDLSPGRAALQKVDPASGKVLATVQLPGQLADADVGARVIWYLSSQGDLAEIDPLTATVTHAYSLAGIAKTPARVVPLLGAVWICDCDSGQILRFDPVAGRVTKVVRLQEKGFLTGVDLGAVSTVWLIDPAAATITPLDATTGEPSGQPLGFGGGNVYDARIGFGSIWVAAGSQLYRFDLATGQRHAIAVPEGASAGGLAIDPEDGKVWVENCGCPDD